MSQRSQTGDQDCQEKRSPTRTNPSHTYLWPDHVTIQGSRIMATLPHLYLKCSSMIMSRVDFSIDYPESVSPNLHTQCPSALLTQQQSPGNQQSGVKLSLQYLGSRVSVNRDELSVFQQTRPGHSIRLFKGYLSPGDVFQISSRRHYGFPFIAFFYINGLLVSHVSLCCEYRFHAGVQQEGRGFFRMTQLSGGKPCDRCVEDHKIYYPNPRRYQSAGDTCEGSVASRQDGVSVTQVQHPWVYPGTSTAVDVSVLESHKTMKWSQHGNYTALSTTQQPNLPAIPCAPTKRRQQRRRRRGETRNPKPAEESDSEQDRDLHKKHQTHRRPPRRDKGTQNPGRSHVDEENIVPPGVKRRDHPGATQRYTVYSEHVTGHNGVKHSYPASTRRTTEEQAQGTHSIQEKLFKALEEGSRFSDVELSDSTDSSDTHISTVTRTADTLPNNMESRLVELHQQGAAKRLDPDEKTVEAMTGGEGDLLCQMVDLAAVLQECDEVDQLVLRNTGMTDTLLQYLVPAIIKSKSQVENINLNLNEISPDGAETLVHLVREKPSIKSLLLFGNQLGDEGITRLMTGLSQLCHMDVYTLSELDLGENQIASTGLKSVAAFLRLNPPLKHLGLAHSTTKSWAAWEELFDAITMNTNLAHLLLDDNHLGDEGARLICGIIRQNRTLLSIDLDSNDIGEEGALAIIESLESKADCALTAISLDNNYISTETRETIENILRNNTD